ncbi:MAG TPA: hypothetical protein DCP71_10545, partial [Verrucomicrobiales bacterium]|nr:hypothetical protein [Verrucomicrobiales bacterium]
MRSFPHFFRQPALRLLIPLLCLGLRPASLLSQEAVFTPLGRTEAATAPSGVLKLATAGTEPVVAVTTGPAGSHRGARWTASTGWQTLPAAAAIVHDLHPNGTRILATSESLNQGGVYDAGAGSWTPLPTMQLTWSTEVFLRWNHLRFFGDGMAAGAARVDTNPYYGLPALQPFHLNLATGIYRQLPRNAPNPHGSLTDLVAVSPQTGNIVALGGTVPAGKLSVFAHPSAPARFFERAFPHSFTSIRHAVISPNNRWLGTASDPASPTGMSARGRIQRWDLSVLEATGTRLSQISPGLNSGYAYPMAMLDDGTCLGYVTGELPSNREGPEACVWHPNGARVRLQHELGTHYQLDLAGWTLDEIHASSPDGKTLSGYGTNPNGQREAWLLQLSEPLPERSPAPEIWVQSVYGHSGSAEAGITFDKVYLNTATAKICILYNIGNAPLEITGLTLEGANADEFSTTFTAPKALAPITSETVSVSFHPRSLGPKEATLKLQTNDARAPVFSIRLTSPGPRPLLTVQENKSYTPPAGTPVPMTALVGRSVEAEFRLDNIGTHIATGITATIEDASVAGLEVLPPVPASLGRNIVGYVRIRYTPQAEGTGTARLQIACDHPTTAPVSIPLALSASTAPWQYEVTDRAGQPVVQGQALPDYGRVTVMAELPYRLTLTSQDQRPAKGVTARLEGPDAGDFESSWDNGPFTLSPNGTASLYIIFQPKSPGIKNARLVLDAEGLWAAPHVIHLTGEGVTAGDVQFVTYPASEMNTPTVNRVFFRVLAPPPTNYRVIRDGQAGMWQELDTQAEFSLGSDYSRYQSDYRIEVRSGNTYHQGPVFNRAEVWQQARVIARPGQTNTAVIPTHIQGPIGGFSYQWFKDGVALSESAPYHYQFVQGPHLIVNTLTPETSGRYQCQVTLKADSGDVTLMAGETEFYVVRPPEIIPFSLRPASTLEELTLEVRATDQEHAPTTFEIKGLPPGLKHTDPNKGIISGKISPSAASKQPREYKVSVKATNSAGTGPVFEALWRIEPFDGRSIAGTYHAFIERKGHHDFFRALGGSLRVTITVGGQFSGSMFHSGRARSVSGQITSIPPANLPETYPYPVPEGMNNGVEASFGVSKAFFLPNKDPAVLGFGVTDNQLGGVLQNIHGTQASIPGFRRQPAPAWLLTSGKTGRHH